MIELMIKNYDMCAYGHTLRNTLQQLYPNHIISYMYFLQDWQVIDGNLLCSSSLYNRVGICIIERLGNFSIFTQRYNNYYYMGILLSSNERKP